MRWIGCARVSVFVVRFAGNRSLGGIPLVTSCHAAACGLLLLLLLLLLMELSLCSVVVHGLVVKQETRRSLGSTLFITLNLIGIL
jgi:hypothetical protein